MSSSSECILNEAAICEFAKCIKKIQGLSSNSASPSDTWLIEFRDNTKYIDIRGRTIEIPRAFCKLFIEPRSLEVWLTNSKLTPELERLWIPKIQLLEGLRYELKFYETIVDNIIQTQKSPHFVKLLSAGDECSFGDLVKALENGGVPYAESSLARNLYHTLGFIQNRPAITTTTIPKWPCNWNDLRFSFILTQQVDSKYSMTFGDWLSTYRETSDFISDLLVILFQICQACYALYLEGACHNDLHSGNVWITRRPDIKKNIRYVIGSSNYIFPQVSLLARVFDFDRAYAERLGSNPLLNQDACSKYGQCNELFQSKDFVKILCYVIKYINDPIYSQMIKGLLRGENTTPAEMLAFESFHSRFQCFFSTYKNPVWNNQAFNKFATYPEILTNIYTSWMAISKTHIPRNITIDEEFELRSPVYNKEPVSYSVISERMPRRTSEITIDNKSKPASIKTVKISNNSDIDKMLNKMLEYDRVGIEDL